MNSEKQVTGQLIGWACVILAVCIFLLIWYKTGMIGSVGVLVYGALEYTGVIAKMKNKKAT